MPIKLLGLALLLSALLLRWGVLRAQRRGYVGPRYRRIHRDRDRWRFRFALGLQVAGALICVVAAALCFTHSIHR